RGGVDVVGVEVGHLAFGDLADLVRGDRPDFVHVRLAGALRDPDRLLDQHRGRRRLGDEGEGAVLVDRDFDRDDRPAFALRLGVEGFAEIHDVDAVLAQRGADRRRRVGVACLDLQLDDGEYFFGHGRWKSVAGCARLDLLHLVVPDLDRRLAAEDRDQDFEFRAVLVDLGDLAGEVRKRAGNDFDRFADGELRLGARALRGL